MDFLAMLVAGLVWQGGTEIAVGGGTRGPWQQNESNYDYVDDPTVAFHEGEPVVAWVDQARKDVFLGGVNVSRSPDTFSWLPRLKITPGNPAVFHLLWQEIIFTGGSHGGDILYARSTDGGRSFSEPLNLSGRSKAGDGKGRTSRERWHNGSIDIAAAPDGTVYAAWTEYEGRLLLAASTDAGKTFSEPRHIGGSDERPARAPSLAIAPDGKLHVAWTDGSIHINGEAIKRRAYADAPKIALDAEGRLHLAWSEDGRVMYRRGLEAPRVVAGGAFPSLELDALGGVYLAWELERGVGFAYAGGGGRVFAVTAPVPGSARAPSGGLQGKLMDKLTVTSDGSKVAVVHSTFAEGARSRIWLFRASPSSRFSLGSG
jgi:hypothetical protein